jgi:hypothetical protein
MKTNHQRKLNLIQLPLSIEQLKKRDLIKNEILNEINKFIQLCFSPQNIQLISTIAIMIESLVKSHHNIDKMSLFIEILKELFPDINDENIAFAQNHIEAELINGRIKGIPIIKLALSYAYEIIFKKILEKIVS